MAALAEPTPGHLLRVLIWIEQAQILLAGLDQMGVGGEGLDTPAPQDDIRLDVEPHVGVEAAQAPLGFAADQLEQGVGDRRHHQRISASAPRNT
ncbi:hypothetical protein D9M68_745820 [compost metagenome]